MRNMQDESNQRLIMIVDDDQALGEMLSIVLESEGFKTVTCLDGCVRWKCSRHCSRI